MNASSSVLVPRAATSPAGVLVARTRPESISEMRSQRAASFMKCVDTKIVTPWLRGQVDQQRPEPVAFQRVHAGGGLVENQDFRRVHNSYRQRQTLADAERQIQRALVAIGGKPEAGDQLCDAGHVDQRPELPA